MNNKRPDLEGSYRSMLVIWAALLMSQFLFVGLIFVVRPKLFAFDLSKPLAGSSSAMIVGFAAAALTAVVFSFLFRGRLNARAVEAQDTGMVQTGMIMGIALCEASSLFGIALAIAFDYQYFFLWLALGIISMVLHFPRRSALEAASFRK